MLTQKYMSGNLGLGIGCAFDIDYQEAQADRFSEHEHLNLFS